MGVFAAPCDSTATPAGEAQFVIVTPVNNLNITMFDCEDGNFDVTWSDAVNVRDTIVIGNRTTVMITGEPATPALRTAPRAPTLLLRGTEAAA